MKKLIFAFIPAVFALAMVVACNKNEGQTATTPPVPGANQYGAWNYGQWYQPYQPYQQQWQATQNNCGCPMGFISVQSMSYGTACAPAAYAQSYNIVYYSWNMGWGPAQNTYQLNNPQAQFVGPSSSCQNSAQGCDTRLNNCPAGSFCQASGGGSAYGLCVH